MRTSRQLQLDPDPECSERPYQAVVLRGEGDGCQLAVKLGLTVQQRGPAIQHPFSGFLHSATTERGGDCRLFKLRQMETYGVQMKVGLPWLVPSMGLSCYF
jgi:hypothetical protein